MFSKFIVFLNLTLLTISHYLQFQNNIIDQNLIANMKLLTSKLNAKGFDDDVYIKNIKNYNDINLINNDSKKIKNREYLSDADYETNKNIKNENNDLFIINLS